MTETKFTPGATARKCNCGHPACDQYILSTQRSSGFDKADADLYVAASDLYATLVRAENYIANTECELGVTLQCGENARAALAKARGES